MNIIKKLTVSLTLVLSLLVSTKAYCDTATFLTYNSVVKFCAGKVICTSIVQTSKGYVVEYYRIDNPKPNPGDPTDPDGTRT
ncbi:hypothetical protein [Aliikangiella coralliicola]|uniref:DUF1496 domain-containing protein n=1 Tax=Aliikangiella coralliicola TaxID=2592383 RepID=A0A545UF10_9GAMM|nr:hypothetical protein [Aliikangiella coralliicola]TQV88048.1 hypothetical protein FLL46_09575 [Aliikangiella coralliicola]